LHIFFALQSYPNWISYTNVANEDFIKKYVASFYFLMTTVTTVGYGDIVCISTYERIYHIILLGIGTIIYSFIVSKIGNYLREQSYEEIKLSKDLTILESIRLTHPSMPFNLYLKIKNHLLNI
jgi:voltage-gated potassium channel